MMYYYPGFGFGIGWIFDILFWILIIWLVVALIRGARIGGHMGPMSHWTYYRGSRAMDILQERYAKGEITKEQFEEMKKNLNS